MFSEEEERDLKFTWFPISSSLWSSVPARQKNKQTNKQAHKQILSFYFFFYQLLTAPKTRNFPLATQGFRTN
jgi:hypothetical protein